MQPVTRYLGKGIYTFGEAGRLLRRPAVQVERWANGYRFQRKHDLGRSAPVLQTDRSNLKVLSFNELIELFFVRQYRQAGVSLPHIRTTAEALAREYGEYPFAAKRLFTDGRFLMIMSDAGLIAPAVGQLIADFAQEFLREIQFDDDLISAWEPLEGEGRVVVDPTREQGQPIVKGTGVQTLALYRAFLKEQAFEPVAAWYEVEPDDVRRAVNFEMRFRNAA